ncbi:hypothetical protein PM082_006359 [Marasmius tenuissimus]|nr:hypothetical protein PM082_006359 [Marasmius tenuissimus]
MKPTPLDWVNIRGYLKAVFRGSSHLKLGLLGRGRFFGLKTSPTTTTPSSLPQEKDYRYHCHGRALKPTVWAKCCRK